MTLGKYGISGKRYKELCGFCEQYPEWIDELRTIDNGLKAQALSCTPSGNTNSVGDPTAKTAMRKTVLIEKIKLVDDTAKEASDEFYKEIIKSVCYGQPFWYLRDIANTPISEKAFGDRRKYFFYLLNAKKA